MKAVKVGTREFREKLASYLLESDWPSLATVRRLATTFLPDANAPRRNVRLSKSLHPSCNGPYQHKESPRRKFSRILSAGVRNSDGLQGNRF